MVGIGAAKSTISFLQMLFIFEGWRLFLVRGNLRHWQYLKGSSPLPISSNSILEALIKTKAHHLVLLSCSAAKPSTASLTPGVLSSGSTAGWEQGSKPGSSPSYCRGNLPEYLFFSKTILSEGRVFFLNIGCNNSERVIFAFLFCCNPINCLKKSNLSKVIYLVFWTSVLCDCVMGN